MMEFVAVTVDEINAQGFLDDICFQVSMTHPNQPTDSRKPLHNGVKDAVRWRRSCPFSFFSSILVLI